MSMDSLKDLYIDELKDLYNAENQLVKALPKMAKKASAPELKRAFQDHLEQTKGHVDRLEKIFKGLGEKPSGKTCKAMKGLVEEGAEIIKEDGDPSVLDAALIGAAQRVEHYEIAGYGVVRTFASLLGDNGRRRNPSADPERRGRNGQEADQTRGIESLTWRPARPTGMERRNPRRRRRKRAGAGKSIPSNYRFATAVRVTAVAISFLVISFSPKRRWD